MSRKPRIGIASFLHAFLVALCLPASLSAMPYQQFDAMNMLDQAEYISVMVDTTQRIFSVSDGANYAAQIEKLFATVEPGASMSLGLAELEGNIDEIRVHDAERFAKDANSLTNAEFEAETPAVQRRYIALLAKIGYPDVVLRREEEDLQKSKKSGGAPFDPNAGSYSPEAKKLRVDLVSKHFPSGSTDQPGFAEVARKIRNDFASKPTANGTMYAVYWYLLELEDAELGKQMKEMEDKTYHVP